MGRACEVLGLSFNKATVKKWLKDLEDYSLVKIDERKDRKMRITLKINSN